jgi:hypothetical protein
MRSAIYDKKKYPSTSKKDNAQTRCSMLAIMEGFQFLIAFFFLFGERADKSDKIELFEEWDWGFVQSDNNQSSMSADVLREDHVIKVRNSSLVPNLQVGCQTEGVTVP